MFGNGLGKSSLMCCTLCSSYWESTRVPREMLSTEGAKRWTEEGQEKGKCQRGL